MYPDECPCMDKHDSDSLRSALITSRDIYRHILKTLSVDVSSPEHVVLEEKANKFDTLIYQLGKITCEEGIKAKKETTKHLTSEEIAKLPIKERIKIAKAITETVSKR